MSNDEVDEQIRALCKQKGLTRYKPWELPPWRVSEQPSPWEGSIGADSWAAALRLRRKLLAELDEADGG